MAENGQIRNHAKMGHFDHWETPVLAFLRTPVVVCIALAGTTLKRALKCDWEGV
jgi:hypothetical protein